LYRYAQKRSALNMRLKHISRPRQTACSHLWEFDESQTTSRANSVNGLVSALIGNIFSTVIGMLKWTWGFVVGFFRLLSGGLDLAEFGFGNLYRIFSFPANVAFGGTILTRLSALGAVA